MNNDWTRENGKEKLWWAENAVGRVYFTSPMSPLQVGYALHSTTNPKEMDRVFNKMHAQEREHNEKIVEQIYNRNREHYERLRSNLLCRLRSAGVSEAEKGIVREALRLMDERDFKMQQNTGYGVSDMQAHEAPLDGKRTRIT